MDSYNRRDFLRLAGMAGAASLAAPGFAFEAAKKRKFKIGSTFILWGYNANNLEPALKDISALGYHGFETFGGVIDEWEKPQRGGFTPLVQKYGVPIISAFCGADVRDPAKRKQGVENLKRWSKLLKANGGTVIEYCADGGRRNFDFSQEKKHMVESMTEYAKVVTDEGLVCALHPHTGTPVETQEEVYYVMENVDTRYMKFGPDVGQLEKGGCDTVKIVKDFMPLIEHVHLKDFAGPGPENLKNGYLAYSPLGEGQVKTEEILNMLEKKRKSMAGMILFELDFDDRNKPKYTPLEAAKVSRDFLAKLDYKFEKKAV